MSYSLAMYQAISIIVLVALKKPECTLFSTKVISEKLGIPAPTVVKILHRLAAAKIILAKEGAKGGILLAKPAGKISLLDIFLALEQDKPLFNTGLEIVFTGKNVDAMKANIQLCLDSAEKEMKQSLKKTTVKDLLVPQSQRGDID